MSEEKEGNVMQEIDKSSSLETVTQSAGNTIASNLTEDNNDNKTDDDKGKEIKTESSAVNLEDKSLPKDQSNIHYEGDICIYTDPESKGQYTWDTAKEEWCPRTVDSKNYKFDGKTYSYCDNITKETFIWDIEANSWKPKIKETNLGTDEKSESEEDDEEEEEDKPKEYTRQDMTKGQYGYENDTHTYTDPSDGTVYLWDKEKSAWFPKVDDDFLAQYQMSYGFVDTNVPAEDKNVEKDTIKSKEVEEQKVDLKRKAPKEPEWFDVGEDCTKVYVSNLPLDLTETEFVDLMQKCGLVMKDLDSGKMKVKLYTDSKSGMFKGDGLCTYIKKESVDLALDLLDGYAFKEKKIKVERARFTMKGDAYDPKLKPKKKRKKDKEKMKKIQEKLFDWRPDKLRHERNKNEKVVIVKNLFEPKIFDQNVGLILEYQQDLNEECVKCGAVRRVIIYDRHPEGVAQVNFKEAEAADACVQLLNNRWFGQRQITAETWDGKTKYKVIETEEETNKRLDGWTKFLEEKDNKKLKDEETVLKEKQKNVKIDEIESDGAGSQDETDEETSDNDKDVKINV